MRLAFRHRVTAIDVRAGRVAGVAGDVLAPTDAPRGVETSREVVSAFTVRADSLVLTSGGIGRDHDLVWRHWPVARLGAAPAAMLSGVRRYVDGRMIGVAETAGAPVVNMGRMWH